MLRLYCSMFLTLHAVFNSRSSLTYIKPFCPSDAIWHHGFVNISWGNSLVSDCTKPLPEPVLMDHWYTVYPKKYAHGFCFAVLCCGYTLTDFPISIRLTSLALWQSNDCPSASKATLINMDKYFMWIHYERLHNHNKAKHNKTVCIFLGIYCRRVPFIGGQSKMSITTVKSLI